MGEANGTWRLHVRIGERVSLAPPCPRGVASAAGNAFAPAYGRKTGSPPVTRLVADNLHKPFTTDISGCLRPSPLLSAHCNGSESIAFVVVATPMVASGNRMGGVAA